MKILTETKKVTTEKSTVQNKAEDKNLGVNKAEAKKAEAEKAKAGKPEAKKAEVNKPEAPKAVRKEYSGRNHVRRSKNGIRSRKRMAKRNREKQRLLIIGGAAAACVVIIGLCVFFGIKSVVDRVPADTICGNIYIEEIDVSGMKADEAKALLDQKFAEYKASSVTLIAEEASAQVTLEELGFQMKNAEKIIEEAVSYGKTGSLLSRYSKVKDLEETKKVFDMDFIVDTERISETIESKMPKLENAAKDAVLTRTDGKFVITDGVKGVAIDVAESAKAIETYMNETWTEDTAQAEIVLVTMVDEPNVTREQLEKVQDVLGKFTTNCGTGGGRVQNIVTGAKLINGAVLMPGEEFSADAAMRPYTYENGYEEAGSYENGKVVQSMGGGICQVSSTLYNACLLAELEITQRQPHSMMVGYVEPSMDAAIAGDYKDLKFKNNTASPIYIEGYVSGGYITFVIYGEETRPESRTVQYISETLSTTPVTKRFVASDASLGSKSTEDSGHTGLKAQLWMVVYENGEEVSREVINTSDYRMSEATVSVGTKSSSSAASSVVKNAIASQNEAKINAAIEEAWNIIAQEQAAAQKPSESVTPPSSSEEGTGIGTQSQSANEIAAEAEE